MVLDDRISVCEISGLKPALRWQALAHNRTVWFLNITIVYFVGLLKDKINSFFIIINKVLCFDPLTIIIVIVLRFIPLQQIKEFVQHLH